MNLTKKVYCKIYDSNNCIFTAISSIIMRFKVGKGVKKETFL